eukprot:CAMPEP_0184482494 /NCGR_PEP_ID=MMETSP0113_2-20130426/4056_1 /TAXON_ID=91329 /ORGANISM="Norrisiella sphaerica, Strain BC52" /LENGTH=377 /DNA_ID=CAMNT_0026862257 /DNA_START=338 /DNA_END=1471 /DNA_ORIENTATION=+
MSSFSVDDIPEVKEAHECATRSDWGGAVQLLERANQVLGSVPELQLLTQTRLANIHQLKGDLAKEISARKAVLAAAINLEPKKKYSSAHALSIALLRAGEIDRALVYCLEPLQDIEELEEETEAKLVASIILAHHPTRHVEVSGVLDSISDTINEANSHFSCAREMIRGRYLLLTSDEDAAHVSLRPSDDVVDAFRRAEEFAPVDSPEILGVASACSGGLLKGLNPGVSTGDSGDGMFYEGQMLRDLEASLNKAVQSFDKLEGDRSTYYLANTLRKLANVKKLKGDGVISEGLFRSVLSKLNSLPKTVFRAQLEAQTTHDYASLLEKMEWNGRSRKSEADKLLAQVPSEGGSTETGHYLNYGSTLDQWIMNTFGGRG